MSVLKTTLRDLRKSKGLQQADLAALVGVRREMTKNNTSRSATKKMTAS